MLILNSIVWSAKLDVPAEGVKTILPDLARFAPASIEPRQRRRNNGVAVVQAHGNHGSRHGRSPEVRRMPGLLRPRFLGKLQQGLPHVLGGGEPI